ncbi:MAG: 2-amino-4-hydroxy-6-hydroxymethyldihydropteridine diphosphokinase [Cellvibrionales bacterium TMED49]|nr:2-amino-4-hydroxy-6-hydroxymethyldihydropteridine diphosphokinase [Porticoccaceae bacterium]OUU39335.1 MAG: 2-amino-4-hydroxy-6-hydroxymethyldihydropteridine diphosphokinase [Cellvibrionales bacterium TMED49]
MSTAFIALGSNLCNPVSQVEKALCAIDNHNFIKLEKVSAFYNSPAIGPGVQPTYCNAVAQISTFLTSEKLLKTLQEVEKHQGRQRGRKWAPRTLDLDILMYDQLTITCGQLLLPHPRMHQRAFVLKPLSDLLTKNFVISNESISSLLDKCQDESKVKRIRCYDLKARRSF